MKNVQMRQIRCNKSREKITNSTKTIKRSNGKIKEEYFNAIFNFYFNAIEIVNYHLKTSRTTTRRPRDFSCTPEYVRHGNHYFAHLVSFENEIF